MTTPDIMADATEDRDRPSYDSRFVVKMIGLAIFSLLIQFSLMVSQPEQLFLTGLISEVNFTMRQSYGYDTRVVPQSTVVWRNEVWVATCEHQYGMVARGSSVVGKADLLAIDPASGKTRTTRIKIDPIPDGMILFDNKLWAISTTSVSCIDDQEQVTQRFPPYILKQASNPFIHQGQLAVIDKDVNDVFRLLVWENRDWKVIGRVSISKQLTAGGGVPFELRVFQHGDRTHLFLVDQNQIFHHEGIDVMSDQEPASALEPINAKMLAESAIGNPIAARAASQAMPKGQTKNWNPIPTALNWAEQWEIGLVNDEITIVICSYHRSQPETWRYTGEAWKSTGLNLEYGTSVGLTSGSQNFLVDDSLRLYELNNRSQRRQITDDQWAIRRLNFLCFAALVTCRHLFSVALLCLGTWWLMKARRCSSYTYGKRHSHLAPIWKRAVARGIDLALMLAPLCFFAVTCEPKRLFDHPYYRFARSEHETVVYFLALILIWVTELLLLSAMQGRWGFTPGKWICGIRVYETTLRPCGMVRGLAREMMIYIDSLLFFNWIPGVLTLAFTRNCQRLGDLAADTIVVEAPSTPWTPS